MSSSNLPPTQGGPLGTARWADPGYIAERYAYREGAIWLGRCPHDPERAIGFEDNRHVFLCAETRSGKGRAFLVNNQVLWPGSLIAIDPKGEAVVTAAARRGPGNADCDGLGQPVYILDPSGIDLPPALDQFRAHFNPLAERVNAQRIAEAQAAGKEPVLANATDLLLRQMGANTACHGEIALTANDQLEYRRGHREGYESVRNAATTQLRFLQGQGMRATVANGGDQADGTGSQPAYPRTFRVEDLKDASISVFLCVQERDYESMRPWLRAMTELLIDAMTERQGLGKSGRRVLFCIDEFANLGEMDSIAKAANAIAGAGVKLMLAVQRLGDLKKLYGEAWEKFIAAAGTQIWFGASADETAKYLESALGQTQVTLYARSVGVNRSTATAETLIESYSHTNSLSTTSGTATSKGQVRGQSQGGSKTSTYGSTDGTSAGRNYGPHLFFEPLQRGTAYNRTSSTQRGTADGEQWSTQESSSETETRNRAETTGQADTTGGGKSRSEQTTEGQSADIREEFHVRPLLMADEARRYLRPMEDNPNDPIEVQEDIREHPAYPGLALIRLATESDPFFVRKAHYDQDPYFVRKFSPNPAFRFVPLEEQPLFGWQITPEFFYTLDPSQVKLPVPDDETDPPLFEDDLAHPGNSLTPILRRVPVNGPDDLVRVDLAQPWLAKQHIRQGEPVLAVSLDDAQDWLIEPPSPEIPAALDFKVIEVYDEATRKAGGQFLKLRAQEPLSEELRTKLDIHFWKVPAFRSSQERRARFRQDRCREARERREAARLRIQQLTDEDRSMDRSRESTHQALMHADERLAESKRRQHAADGAIGVKDIVMKFYRRAFDNQKTSEIAAFIAILLALLASSAGFASLHFFFVAKFPWLESAGAITVLREALNYYGNLIQEAPVAFWVKFWVTYILVATLVAIFTMRNMKEDWGTLTRAETAETFFGLVLYAPAILFTSIFFMLFSSYFYSQGASWQSRWPSGIS